MRSLRRLWCRMFGHRLYMGDVTARAWVKPQGGEWALLQDQATLCMCSRCDYVEPFTFEIAPPAGSCVRIETTGGEKRDANQ